MLHHQLICVTCGGVMSVTCVMGVTGPTEAACCTTSCPGLGLPWMMVCENSCACREEEWHV